VLKLAKLIYCNEEQLLKSIAILFIFSELKYEKSIEIKAEQLLNISSILTTF
jgi:hypothetical protein